MVALIVCVSIKFFSFDSVNVSDAFNAHAAEIIKSKNVVFIGMTSRVIFELWEFAFESNLEMISIDSKRFNCYHKLYNTIFGAFTRPRRKGELSVETYN